MTDRTRCRSGAPAASHGRGSQTRALAPLVGVLALLTITIALAAVVAVGASSISTGSVAPTAAFELAVDGATIEIRHLSGDAIDVESLSMTIAVEGTELSHQPPVPFVGAAGFDGPPTGPLNPESDSEWRSGESARLTVAGTNSPTIERGDAIEVELVADDHRIGTLETTA